MLHKMYYNGSTGLLSRDKKNPKAMILVKNTNK